MIDAQMWFVWILGLIVLGLAAYVLKGMKIKTSVDASIVKRQIAMLLGCSAFIGIIVVAIHKSVSMIGGLIVGLIAGIATVIGLWWCSRFQSEKTKDVFSEGLARGLGVVGIQLLSIAALYTIAGLSGMSEQHIPFALIGYLVGITLTGICTQVARADAVSDMASASWSSSVMQTIALGMVASMMIGAMLYSDIGTNGMLFPLLMLGVASVVSAASLLFVRKMKMSINHAAYASTILMCIVLYVLTKRMLLSGWLFAAGVTGVIGGIIIASVMKYYTETTFRPAKSVLKAQTLSASVIRGIATTWESVLIPIAVLSASLYMSFKFGSWSGFEFGGWYGLVVAYTAGAALSPMLIAGLHVTERVSDEMHAERVGSRTHWWMFSVLSVVLVLSAFKQMSLSQVSVFAQIVLGIALLLACASMIARLCAHNWNGKLDSQLDEFGHVWAQRMLWCTIWIVVSVIAVGKMGASALSGFVISVSAFAAVLGFAGNVSQFMWFNAAEKSKNGVGESKEIGSMMGTVSRCVMVCAQLVCVLALALSPLFV